MTVALAAGAIEYDFEIDAQGWAAGVGADHGMTNFAASDGKIGFDYVTPTASFDPMIISPGGLTINATSTYWLVLEVNMTAEAGTGAKQFQVFFQNEAGGFSEGRSRRFNVTPNLGWQTITFNMSIGPGDPWTGTVSRFRIDPGSNVTGLAGYRCEFERIAIVGFLDTDNDGISDEAELLIFGDLETASVYSDYDGDGLRDALEIALGFDPKYPDASFVPAGGTWALLTLAACLTAAAGLVLRRRAYCAARR